jgi:hypothetical protein
MSDPHSEEAYTEDAYTEEAFGILTEDNLYLDCVLVRPPNLEDAQLKALRVWVPRYPLTKGSVITCARQEMEAGNRTARVAHLVFDLRGTGDSEGQATDRNFDRDLQAIRLWAAERFGPINVGFLGRPFGSERLHVQPIRPGVVMELYNYDGNSSQEKPLLIYLSTYGNFSGNDEAACEALSAAGYNVYALDPLRYLLHAAAREILKPPELWQDLRTLCAALQQSGEQPVYVVGRPVAAGLALLWSSGVEAIRGVVAVGQAQIAFKPKHIFSSGNPHTFFLGRHVHRIGPRAAAFVLEEGNRLGGTRDELAALHETCTGPRRMVKAEHVTPQLLLELLQWLREATPA